ncbi:MAG: translation initiation factor IF-3 [Candidatus Pacebacteria bacterium]|nr:translation initiation factor IF-3 [Candidatus Paceibacterota bacterium]MDD5012808.1 translation initiation factor IF-3 [Candidatus Paceibacterota bacterium]MDD5752548.1 translation initiation factor IF-3 [Candidatus Paceibacterota bacterium]
MNKTLYNNQIRAEEVRLIDTEGQQVGVLPLSKAIEMAKEKGLDLIQVTEKVSPPICRIGDYGKYLYQLQKKERKILTGSKKSEVKTIKLSFNISDNDLLTRVSASEKILKKGGKVRIELRLKGREKRLPEVGVEKINKFIDKIKEKIDIKIEKELKKEPKGLSMIILKK